MKTRVLMILEGGAAHPSAVVRALVYRDHFRRNGYEVTIRSRRSAFLFRLVLRPPRLLASITGKGPGRLILYGLMELLARLSEPLLVRAARRHDVVFTSKVQSYRLMKKLRATGRPIVFDFVDALWLSSRERHFEESLRLVDEITVDNEYTARFARALNERCTVVPDPPQVELFDRFRATHRRKAVDDRIVLGWIGSPTAAYNLFLIWPVLERLFARYPSIHLRLVGIGVDARLVPPFETVRFSTRATYDQKTMVEEVLGFDIGLFPQFDVEQERVRGVLKATVYMSGEAAVIASPVGQTRDLLHDGVNGMLAATPAEWEGKLSALIEQEALRQRLAAEALRQVRSSFSIDASFSVLDGVIRRALATRRDQRDAVTA